MLTCTRNRPASCAHRGTVWRVRVLHASPEADVKPYECTRCGAQWDSDPRPTYLA